MAFVKKKTPGSMARRAERGLWTLKDWANKFGSRSPPEFASTRKPWMLEALEVAWKISDENSTNNHPVTPSRIDRVVADEILALRRESYYFLGMDVRKPSPIAEH